ncbi:MAG: metallophosphoesterase [Chloroflexi bacterium]|nr:MAG: metallophosphoesterase [Chloroflexota bacterium]
MITTAGTQSQGCAWLDCRARRSLLLSARNSYWLPNVDATMPTTSTRTSTRRRFNRRRFLQLLAGAGLALGGAAGYTRLIEPHWVEVDELTLPIPRLSPAADGTRFVQISDIHLSEYFSPDRLSDALARVRRLAPQWVVLTGDYVGHSAESAQGLVEPLRQLGIPVYAGFGNHDHWTDRPTVQRYLEAAGATILLNQALAVADDLWLAGIDDVWSGRPDLAAALRDIPSRATAVLLAHEPDYFDYLIQTDAPVTLQLSGHSHGGQVRFPQSEPDAAGHYSWAPILPKHGRRYPIGLRTIGTRMVYTNRGLGVWPVPIRFNCRPEITLITLRTA